MEKPQHPLAELFRQLGLGAGEAEISAFIARHAPLDHTLRLTDAPFWTDTQAQFLREAVGDDADWAAVVEQLDVLLREPPGVA